MNIDLSKPIYSQVKNLDPQQYKSAVEKIVLKKKDVYDYKKIRIYDYYIFDVLSNSSLELCYIFWLGCISILFYFSWSSIIFRSLFTILNLIKFIFGMMTWFNYAHYFHSIIHKKPIEDFSGIWRLWHFNGHGYHHMFPYDYRRIVIHPWIASVAILPTYLLLLGFRILNFISLTTECLFITGLIIGHIYIETSHYSLHYDTFLTPYLKRLQYHHMSHHLKVPERKFAYFHPIEDIIRKTN